MADPRKKFTVQEVLNSALNTDADALKVDLEGANIAATLDVQLDAANDSVALKTAVESNIAKLATINTDIAAMKSDIAAIKATTDKLDACINASDQLEVKTNS
tara:strand:+ start:13066 stop:13374 length:309 start_codon:yes stop_codon:yes gene_type:complete